MVDIIIVQFFLLLFSAAEHCRTYSEKSCMFFFCDGMTDGTGVSFLGKLVVLSRNVV